MNVILQQDVKALGKAGQMVKVSDGYARNFLFPKKLAVEANNANVNKMNTQNEAAAFHKAEEKAAAQAKCSAITDTTVTLRAKAGAGGKLFGTVTAKEIAAELKKTGTDIDKKKITLSAPIKAFGTYSAEVRLYPGITAKINVKVIEE